MELFDFMTKPRDLKDILSEAKYKRIHDDAEKLYKRFSKSQSGEVLTASRTLIETTCKTLLDHLAIEYGKKEHLPRLAGRLNRALDLHPASTTAETLKQILSGVINIVQGVAAIRNEHGDAHGRGVDMKKLPFYHAELIAYLACSLTRYYIEAYENKVNRKTVSNLNSLEKDKFIDIWVEVAEKYGITNPDNLPYTGMLEEIAQKFTQEAGIVLARNDIFVGLINLRKNSNLPKTRSELQEIREKTHSGND